MNFMTCSRVTPGLAVIRTRMPVVGNFGCSMFSPFLCVEWLTLCHEIGGLYHRGRLRGRSSRLTLVGGARTNEPVESRDVGDHQQRHIQNGDDVGGAKLAGDGGKIKLG